MIFASPASDGLERDGQKPHQIGVDQRDEVPVSSKPVVHAGSSIGSRREPLSSRASGTITPTAITAPGIA